MQNLLDKKTIVIGLEDVLVRLSLEELEDFDLAFSLSIKVYVKFRPFMFEFLENISDRFEVIVYCKGGEEYCSSILEAIEKKKTYFSHKLYKDHVLFENLKYSVKYYDFLMGNGRSVDNTIILDQNVGVFCLNMFNGIPISPFLSSRTDIYDIQLACVAQYLEHLKDVPSICDAISASLREAMLNQVKIGYNNDPESEEEVEQDSEYLLTN